MPYSRKEEAKKRLLTICEKENISYTEDGLKALIFTAQGDLRQAINNLQSCFDGFEKVTGENVFKVCDEPHPVQIKEMIGHCLERNFDKAYTILAHLWELGYSPEDIIVNMFRVTKNNEMGEYLKLEFVKEIGVTHAEEMKRVISRLLLKMLV